MYEELVQCIGKIAPRKHRHLEIQPTMSLAKLYRGVPPRSHSRSESRISPVKSQETKSPTKDNPRKRDPQLTFTSQLSELPKASEKLMKTRQEPPPIRRIEKREKIERDFLSQFAFDVDPQAEVYCKVLYGPLPVRAQSDSRSIKVGFTFYHGFEFVGPFD
eukprot:SAG31_NODE_10510_length_1130_cov_1.005820_1_plen_161_part_00